MSTRHPGAFLALGVAALLAPAPGAAFEWQLRTGLEYRRDDLRLADRSDTIPHLDLDLALDAGGALFAPGIVDWSGGVEYRRQTTRQDGVDAERDRLSYRARTTALGNPRSPLTLTAHATRIDDDFTTEGTAAGALLQTITGGSIELKPRSSRPWLRAAYDNLRSEQDALALGRSDRTLHALTLGAGHGAPTFSYNVGYRANFSEGTFLLDRYNDHRVDVDAGVDIASGLKLRMSSLYFLRTNTSNAVFDPRQEMNAFSASLNDIRDPKSVQLGTYNYARGVQTVPAGFELERVQHRLGYALVRVLPDPEWKIRGSLDASLVEDRVGTEESRATGEAAGATAYWRRTRDGGYLELRGGPTLGLTQPTDGDSVFGYGGTSGVTVMRRWVAQTSLAYDLFYDRDLRGNLGWSFRQQLVGTAEMPLRAGIARGTLQASAERRESDLLGPGASRSITAILGYRVRKSDVQLTAGLQDNLSPAPSAETTGDGLFLAPRFDSHVLTASLGASTVVWRYLTLRGRLRHSSVDLPDRPALDESEAFAAVELGYGALRLALEDTYVVSEVPDGKLRVNRIFVKAYRVFGSRF